MKKNVLILTLTGLLGLGTLNAQVGIGTESPANSSILDVVSTNKGILVPRVNLVSITIDLDNEPGQDRGLLVFNTGTTLEEGFYFWNGSEWRSIEDGTAVVPEIEELRCLEATLEPQVFTATQTYKGIMKVPYNGGNGGKYSIGSWIESTGNTGLKARLKAGQLEFGSGFLVFDIEGIPAQSSPNGASFEISFGTDNVQTCTVTVGEVVEADIRSKATLGPIQATSDNGANGYHRMITTSDGKFSVRVFVPDNTNLSLADLQIRSNIGDITLMWNGHTSYMGGNFGQATNVLRLPQGGMWYGCTPASGATVTAVPVSGTGGNVNAAWGDPDVYYEAPEQRRYMWTTTDVTDKTTYMLTFMMGAPTPNVPANATNAPNTKAFLRIEEIRAAE